MESTRIFPRSKDYIINTLYDIIELQKGALILSDTARGVVYYRVSMYGYEWEYMYTIGDMRNHEGQTHNTRQAPPHHEQCSATLRISGDRRETEREIRRAFALLESMLDLK